MGYDMNQGLADAEKSMVSMRDYKLKKKNDMMDSLMKRAQLAEAGYDIQGDNIVQRPDYISSKQAQSRKDLAEAGLKEAELEFVRGGVPPMGGMLPPLGSPQQSLGAGMKVKQFDKYGRPESYEPAGKLTNAQELKKDASTKEIYEKHELNKVRSGILDKAIEGADKVPQGWLGKQRLNISKAWPLAKGVLGVSDKQIQDAQELKMALTSGTLAETAYTKGAISDSEMALFKDASANNDFNSPAIQPVLAKLRAFIDAENAGLTGAFKRNYNEDPNEWFKDEGGAKNYNSPEEADASEKPGAVVMVQGRKYQV